MQVLSRNPDRLLRVLDEETVKREYVIKNYNFHHGLPTVDLLSLFPDFAETIDPYTFLEGTSMLTDLALLKSIAKTHNRCAYLEIGTWRGESVANVASVADDCTSISLSDNEMRKLGFSEDFISNSGFFSKDFSNVDHIGHDSRSFDFSKLGKQFDLIFIDGDHSYETVKKDTMNAFKLLKDEKSAIVWHDYGIGTEAVRWSVLAGLLDGCPKDRIDSIFHVSNTLCAVYMKGNFKTTYPRPYAIPTKKFRVKICSEKLTNNKY